MSAYDALIADLQATAQRRDADRRVDSLNAEIDQAIAAGCPAIQVAKLEAVRNRVPGTSRTWHGKTV